MQVSNVTYSNIVSKDVDNNNNKIYYISIKRNERQK